MKKYFLLGSLLMMATVASATTLSAAEDAAQVKNAPSAPSSVSTGKAKEDVDTLSMRKLQEVQVVSTRALKNAPIAYSSLSKGEIEEINHGKDIPFLLSLSPSVLTSSDAGMGIGYTTMRVRGTDATRINVTANGIPLNDAESNGLYWVNMPDFASSLNSMELQRGVGTSTNGSGAFGATLNMETEKISADPYFRFDGSAGSYGTHKETLRFGTGLLGGHWGFSGRLSNIGTDGFIDRASARLNSYFLQAGYFGETTMVKFITFNGTEKTYHAWDYATREDMATYGRSYNPCGKFKDNEGNTVFYKDQTDNYHQQHYQLLLNQQLGQPFSLNVALHYTHGFGYYEQYKKDQALYKYAFAAPLNTAYSDLVRQKKVDNDFYGTVLSLNYQDEGLQATLGGGWNKYDGSHYGNVIWVRQAEAPIMPNHRYYDNMAHKQDMNVYGKMSYEFLPGLNAWGDVQYRYVDYRMDGPSDNYISGNQYSYDLKTCFSFLNPKAGLLWRFAPGQEVYASYALAQKEPTRNDFEDNIGADRPRAEKLHDFELGYHFSSPTFAAGLNLYYMLYKDQFVLTGQQNAIGEMMASNIGDSYRRGLELTAAWKPCPYFSWEGNATWSHNRSRNLKFLLDDTQEYFNVKSAPLSFSPDLTVKSILRGRYKGLEVTLSTQFVDEQYMTTTGLRSYQDGDHETSLMLDRFCVSDLDLSYNFTKLRFVKGLRLGVTIYNLFGTNYESFGAAYTAVRSDGRGGMQGYQTDGWDSYSVYSAQAPMHFLAHLSINF